MMLGLIKNIIYVIDNISILNKAGIRRCIGTAGRLAVGCKGLQELAFSCTGPAGAVSQLHGLESVAGAGVSCMGPHGLEGAPHVLVYLLATKLDGIWCLATRDEKAAGSTVL